MVESAPPLTESTANDLFHGYSFGEAYDEMFEAPGRPRPHYQTLFRRLQGVDQPLDFMDIDVLIVGVGVDQ